MVRELEGMSIYLRSNCCQAQALWSILSLVQLYGCTHRRVTVCGLSGIVYSIRKKIEKQMTGDFSFKCLFW